LHVVGQPFGQHAPEVEDVDEIADTNDERYVVLDHQDRQVEEVAQLEQLVAEAVRLLRPHPRARLVQKQDVGIGGQGRGDLDPLEGAVRQPLDG